MAERAARARTPRRRAAGSTLQTDQPVVAIVGYPNVGKSTLFNRLAGRRDAVVDAVPGVTRDRRQAGAEWNGRAFQLLDTGGIDEADPTDVGRQIAAQALRGIEDADLVHLRRGRHRRADRRRPGDRRPPAPQRPAADAGGQQGRRPAPRRPRPRTCAARASATPTRSRRSTGGGWATCSTPWSSGCRTRRRPPMPAERPPAICIIGRPNVGKSSLLNALLGEDRVVVHDAPGHHARPHRHGHRG